MANSSQNKRFYTPVELGLSAASATTGAWTLAFSAAGAPTSTVSLDKAAAATNSVLHITLPKGSKGNGYEDSPIASFALFYNTTTADHTTAPAVVLRKYTMNTTTGLVVIATVATTLVFSGVDAIGKVSGAAAAGAHIATATITTPAALLDNESLVSTWTMGEAATSVLDITGMQVTYN